MSPRPGWKEELGLVSEEESRGGSFCPKPLAFLLFSFSLLKTVLH